MPLAEVLGGSAPHGPESRANAFAAELLCPRKVAGDELAAIKTAKEAEDSVRRLGDRYGASREIIAWQAFRSGATLTAPARAHLMNLLPQHLRYQVV